MNSTLRDFLTLQECRLSDAASSMPDCRSEAADIPTIFGSYDWIIEIHIPLLKAVEGFRVDNTLHCDNSEIMNIGSCGNDHVGFMRSTDLGELVNQMVGSEIFIHRLATTSGIEWAHSLPSIQSDSILSHESVAASACEYLARTESALSALSERSVMDLWDYCYRKVRTMFESPVHLHPSRAELRSIFRKLAWSSGYDDCLTRSRSRVQFSMPTLFPFRSLPFPGCTRLLQIGIETTSWPAPLPPNLLCSSLLLTILNSVRRLHASGFPEV
jgi:hypothetical protein